MASLEMPSGGDGVPTAAALNEPLVAGARPFLVERFFAKHEFSAQYMLGSSDAESWTARELLELAASRGDSNAQHEWADLALGYTESAGHPDLRRGISQLYGEPIGADQVLCVVPEEGIFLTMTALLEPGDEVIAMMPAYQSLYEIARAKGCVVRPWWADYEAGRGWSFSLDKLRKLLAIGKERVRMVIVNIPHNPTSWMPKPDEHHELVSICQDNGFLLFSDEIYWGMARMESKEHVSSCTRYNKAITLGGLSKAYGLPGLRVGWLATSDAQILAKLQQAKDYTTICGSGPSEILAIIALRHGDAMLARAWNLARAHRQHLESFCGEFSDLFEWAPDSATGLMTFVVLRGWAANMGAQRFADWCVQVSSCVMVPSDCFDMPDPPAVRFGLGRRNFPEALAALKSKLVIHRGGPEAAVQQ